MTTATVQKSIEEQVRQMVPVSAPPDERQNMAELLRFLDSVAHTFPRPETCSLVGPNGERISIPESVFYMLERVVKVMARGDSITIVPVGQELTTQQAANLLNVSRQYLVRLLEDEKIPFTKTGRHRRVNVEDVLRFKEQRDRDRLSKLENLAEMSQDFGGYSELK